MKNWDDTQPMRKMFSCSFLLLVLLLVGCAGRVPDSVISSVINKAASDEGRVPITGFAEANYFIRKIADEKWHCYRFSVLRNVTDRFAYFTELEVDLQFVQRGSDWYHRIGDVKATERAKKLKEQLVEVRRMLSEDIADKVVAHDMDGVHSGFQMFASEAKRLGLTTDEIKNIDAAILKRADQKVDFQSGAAQRAQGVNPIKDRGNVESVKQSIGCLEALQQKIADFEATLAPN